MSNLRRLRRASITRSLTLGKCRNLHGIACLQLRGVNICSCYIASAETKRDWLIHGHVALDKCNVSLGQQVNNCSPLRPAPYINKQNGGETRKFINSHFRAFCLKKYTIGREDMLLKLKFNYSSKFWLF